VLADNFSGLHDLSNEEAQTIWIKFIFRIYSVHPPSTVFNQENCSNFEMKRPKTNIENICQLGIFCCVRCVHNPDKIVTWVWYVEVTNSSPTVRRHSFFWDTRVCNKGKEVAFQVRITHKYISQCNNKILHLLFT